MKRDDLADASARRTEEQAAFADHAGLPFPLLTDVERWLSTALRLPAFRSAGTDRYKRQTLLLDAEGTVRHALTNRL